MFDSNALFLKTNRSTMNFILFFIQTKTTTAMILIEYKQ